MYKLPTLYEYTNMGALLEGVEKEEKLCISQDNVTGELTSS